MIRTENPRIQINGVTYKATWLLTLLSAVGKFKKNVNLEEILKTWILYFFNTGWYGKSFEHGLDCEYLIHLKHFPSKALFVGLPYVSFVEIKLKLILVNYGSRRWWQKYTAVSQSILESRQLVYYSFDLRQKQMLLD
jgi:hypothetical protein